MNAQLQFTLDLFQELNHQNVTGALLVSPISIVVALSMIYMGSNGETRRQFQQRFDIDHNSEHHFYTEISKFVKSSHDSNSLVQTWAHGYLNVGKKLETTYQNKLIELYGTSIEHLNYARPLTAAEHVNLDVAIHTNNKIKQIVDASVFEDPQSIILASAIYLKANWYNKFSTSSLKHFYSSPTLRRQIDVMYLETGQLSKGCKYAENDKFKLLQLPYADKSTDELSDVYFNVFLPRERFGLNSALRNSSAKSMSELIGQLRGRDLIVHLPSFKMDCKVELRETLRLIGLADGFDSMKANFSGIAKHEPYFIGDVTQKTTIEVTKEGTEASATTVLEAVWKSVYYPYKLTEFLVDQPFFYMITTRNTILFAGIYN